MKIRVVRPFAIKGKGQKVGEVIEVDDKTARAIIGTKRAEAVTAEDAPAEEKPPKKGK